MTHKERSHKEKYGLTNYTHRKVRIIYDILTNFHPDDYKSVGSGKLKVDDGLLNHIQSYGTPERNFSEDPERHGVNLVFEVSTPGFKINLLENPQIL